MTISDTINAAKAAAEAANLKANEGGASKTENYDPSQDENSKSVVIDQGGAVAPAGKPLSLIDALKVVQRRVSLFLKIPSGSAFMQLGAEGSPHKKFKVRVKMSNIVTLKQISFSQGNQFKVFKSYDGGVTDGTTHRPWPTVCAEALKVAGHPHGQDYDTFEVKFELAEDLLAEGKVEQPKGTIFGYTPSWSGAPEVGKLLAYAFAQAGEAGFANATVLAEMSVDVRTGKGNKYSVPVYNILGLE